MKKILLIFSILLIANTFTSCKKEKDEKPKPSKEELLTAHEWYGIDLVGYVNEEQVGDPESMLGFSMLFGVNNYVFFYENGELSDYAKWTYVEGSPDTINISEPPSMPATHPFIIPQANRSVNDLIANIWYLDKLTEDKFTFHWEGTNDDGDPIKVVFHLKK